jgi:hypothetical protein
MSQLIRNKVYETTNSIKYMSKQTQMKYTSLAN